MLWGRGVTVHRSIQEIDIEISDVGERLDIEEGAQILTECPGGQVEEAVGPLGDGGLG